MKKIILFIIIVTLFVSCDVTKNSDNNKIDMEQLNVPGGFNYETSKIVEIEMNMPDSVLFNNSKSRYDIYNVLENKENKLVSSGSFNEQGYSKKKIKIPNCVSEIMVSTIAGDITASLPEFEKEGDITLDFGDDYDYTAPDTVEPAAKNFPNKHKYNYRNNRVNVIGNGDFSENDFGTIPYWEATIPVDQKWYFTDYWMGTMEWMSDIGGGSIRTKPGYYYGGASQWINASQGDVISFSADIKSDINGFRQYAYLYLIPRRSDGSILGYYAKYYFFPDNDWTNKTAVASMPYDTEYCQVLIWNKTYSGSGSVYYDNVVVTGPEVDSDGDGVVDEDDDYPNDPNKAYNTYYPSYDTYGTLAFEDNWPSKGDYDFNDIVIDYNFNQVLNADNEVVEIVGDLKLMAIGAGFHNGFYLQFPFTQDKVQNLENNGNSTISFETGTTNSVLCIFTDAFDLMQSPAGASGTWVNTVEGEEYVTPAELTFTIELSVPLPPDDFAYLPPYNPFLTVNGTRGREVHLSDYPPTSLVDQSLFGTEADDSDPSQDRYYKTTTNLPWAVVIPEEWNYPIEKAEITWGYLHFADWAESGGSQNNDWYELSQGQIEEEYIYFE